MIEVYEIIFKSNLVHVDEKWFLGGQNIENSIFFKIWKKLRANYYINFDRGFLKKGSLYDLNKNCS